MVYVLRHHLKRKRSDDVSLKSVGLGKLLRKASSEQEDKKPKERTERSAAIRMESTVGRDIPSFSFLWEPPY